MIDLKVEEGSENFFKQGNFFSYLILKDFSAKSISFIGDYRFKQSGSLIRASNLREINATRVTVEDILLETPLLEFVNMTGKFNKVSVTNFTGTSAFSLDTKSRLTIDNSKFMSIRNWNGMTFMSDGLAFKSNEFLIQKPGILINNTCFSENFGMWGSALGIHKTKVDETYRVENSEIKNSFAFAGGGIFLGVEEDLELKGVEIKNNSAFFGSGMFIFGGTINHLGENWGFSDSSRPQKRILGTSSSDSYSSDSSKRSSDSSSDSTRREERPFSLKVSHNKNIIDGSHQSIYGCQLPKIALLVDPSSNPVTGEDPSFFEFYDILRNKTIYEINMDLETIEGSLNMFKMFYAGTEEISKQLQKIKEKAVLSQRTFDVLIQKNSSFSAADLISAPNKPSLFKVKAELGIRLLSNVSFGYVDCQNQLLSPSIFPENDFKLTLEAFSGNEATLLNQIVIDDQIHSETNLNYKTVMGLIEEELPYSLSSSQIIMQATLNSGENRASHFLVEVGREPCLSGY